jgi:hypothetical protein
VGATVEVLDWSGTRCADGALAAEHGGSCAGVLSLRELQRSLI